MSNYPETAKETSGTSETESPEKYRRLLTNAEAQWQGHIDRAPSKYRGRRTASKQCGQYSTSEGESNREHETPDNSLRKRNRKRRQYQRKQNESTSDSDAETEIIDIINHVPRARRSVIPEGKSSDTELSTNNGEELNVGNCFSNSSSEAEGDNNASSVISTSCEGESCHGQVETESESDKISSTSSSSNEDDESQELNELEELLFCGSTLTVGASCTLILQFCRKYKLSRKAQDDLLHLVILHCPNDAEQRMPKTHRQLVKKVIPLQKDIHKQHVCTRCNEVVAVDHTECENGHHLGSSKKQSCFYSIPLEPQLKMLIKGKISILNS